MKMHNARRRHTTRAERMLPTETLFGEVGVLGGRLSPDGRWMAIRRPSKHVTNVWLKRVDEPLSAARMITNETQPVLNLFWSHDSRRLLFIKDVSGSEMTGIGAVEIDRDGRTSAPYDVAVKTGASVVVCSVPKCDPERLYVTVNDRDYFWPDLYKVSLADGARALVRLNTDRMTRWICDARGHLRLGLTVDDDGTSHVVRLDEEVPRRIFSADVLEIFEPLRFHPDGHRLYVRTSVGSDIGLVGLALLDINTGQLAMEETDPLGRVDLYRVIFSNVVGSVLATEYRDDRLRRRWRNTRDERDGAWLAEMFPDLDIEFETHVDDDRSWLITTRGDREPGQVHTCDRARRTVRLQYRLSETIDRSALVAMTPFRYNAADGLDIPGYLLLPSGVAPEGLPTLIMAHPGPWERAYWGFDALAQFCANRGYAVLIPNFRGSTGYGTAFLDAGNGEWGAKMQDDLTSGVRAVIARGIADPARVGICGASYGGYAALAGAAFTPGLYRAAIDLMGPSNLLTLLESIPPSFGGRRALLFRRIADPFTAAGRVRLKDRSPVHSVERCTSALLVVHGGRDRRVPQSQSNQIVTCARAAGVDVEYLVFRDESHYYARASCGIALVTAIERFLAMHLGGRCQTVTDPEIEGILDAARVRAPRTTGSNGKDLDRKLGGLSENG